MIKGLEFILWCVVGVILLPLSPKFFYCALVIGIKMKLEANDD